MLFHPFEITAPHIVYALLGAFIVLFGMFSLLLREKLYIGEAIWAFLFGIIIGPYGANIFDPRAWSHNSEEVTNVITLEFTRVVLAIGVFAIGVELPKAYMAKHKRSLFFLLVPVMTWGWFVSAALIFALIPSLNFLSSLAIAACLTPTDPILAAAVVGGKWADKHVPAHIRHLLAAESGCNDGAAFPFLFLALYLMISDGHPGIAIRDWFLKLWLYQVILGAIIGALLGYAFRHLMKFCERRNLIDRHSYVAQYISLAILTIGICTLLGSDDLLAAFCCGTAFAWDGFFNRQTEESSFSSVIDLLFNIAAFIYVGAWMPFNKFQDAELTITVWRLVVIAILVLILRRLPVMIMCYKWIPDIKTFREALFAGHFGPIGVGAVFISTLAVEVLHNAHKDDDAQVHLVMETIQPIVGFMVLCSIAVHGMSIPGFSLGRRVHSVSRTWSRRDTGHSATPDWAQNTRIVTRGEDIVINRDRLDPERGGLTVLGVHELKKAPSATSSSNEKPRTLMGEDEVRVKEGETEMRTPPVPDYRDETPPDGTEVLAEWVEGHHRVIERRAGPGDDVEVIVTNENPDAPDAFIPQTKWRGARHEYIKDARQIAHTIRTELQALGHKAREIVSPRRSKDQLKRQKSEDKVPSSTVYENAIADDDDDDDDEDGWASDSGSVNDSPNPNQPHPVVTRPTPSSPSSSSPPRRRPSRPTGKPFVVHAHRPGSTRRPSFRRNSIDTSKEDSEIVEVSRGRETRPTTASSTVSLGSASVLHSSGSMGRMSVGAGASGGGAMGYHHHQGSRHSRPGTADSASGRYGGGAGGHHTRPGTGDSARHARIEGIRQIHGRNTRESSPSRSVRFVDTDASANGGRSGLVSRASVNELFAKSVMDSPVDEEPTRA